MMKNKRNRTDYFGIGMSPIRLTLALVLCLFIVPSFSITCDDCVVFWNSFRKGVGCNANSSIVCTIADYMFNINKTECQKVVNMICAKGCETNPDACALVACRLLLGRSACPLSFSVEHQGGSETAQKEKAAFWKRALHIEQKQSYQ